MRRPVGSAVGLAADCRDAKATARVGHSLRQRDERGGAVSLLVILMTPTLALAAIVAAAVPQRLAAQAAMEDTAAELAVMAAVWRHAQGRPHDPVGWYFPDCTAPGSPPSTDADSPDREDITDDLKPETERRSATDQNAALRHACEAATHSLLASLGARGIDAHRLGGAYTSAYSSIATPAPDDAHLAHVPCRVADSTIVAEAVQLGVAAPWGTQRWDTAQVWPRGITITGQSLGIVAQPVAGTDATTALPACTAFRRSPNQPGSFATSDSTPTRTAFGNPVVP